MARIGKQANLALPVLGFGVAITIVGIVVVSCFGGYDIPRETISISISPADSARLAIAVEAFGSHADTCTLITPKAHVYDLFYGPADILWIETGGNVGITPPEFHPDAVLHIDTSPSQPKPFI